MVLTVRQYGPGEVGCCPLREIPNLPVLLELVEMHTQVFLPENLRRLLRPGRG